MNSTVSDHHDLFDIQGIKIKKDLPASERIRAYLGQVSDLYHFSVGDTIVAIRFNGEKSLTDRLTYAFRTAIR